MATKDDKRQLREMIEALEYRVHSGPPIIPAEVESVRDFLREKEFSQASDYHRRLGELQSRLTNRLPRTESLAKRDYGGKAGERHLQLQSIFDHIIISTCYDGVFNTQHGRIKLSHRFNRAGRLDFVELKFLKSLHPCLTGEIRKLVMVQNFQASRPDWLRAEAFVLETMPRELIFLYRDIFHCAREEMLAWLVNIGHRLTTDLLKALPAAAGVRRANGAELLIGQAQTANGHKNGNGHSPLAPSAGLGVHRNLDSVVRNSAPTCLAEPERRPPAGAQAGRNRLQLDIEMVLNDPVARPILETAARLECSAECGVDGLAVLWYHQV